MDFITTCRPKIRKKRSTDLTLWENKRVSFISSIFWLQSERLEPKNDTSTTVGFKQELTLYIKTYTYSSYYPVCISIVTEKKNLSENHKLFCLVIISFNLMIFIWDSAVKCSFYPWQTKRLCWMLFIRTKTQFFPEGEHHWKSLFFPKKISCWSKLKLESSYFNVLNVYTNNWPILIRTLASQCRVKE